MERIWRVAISVLMAILLCFNWLILPVNASFITNSVNINEIAKFNETYSSDANKLSEENATGSDTSDIVQETLKYEDENIIVEIGCTGEDNIPQSAEIAISTIDEACDKFKDYHNNAEVFHQNNGYSMMNFALFWEISLFADGEQIVVPTSLPVTITLKDGHNPVNKNENERLHLLSFSKLQEPLELTYSIGDSFAEDAKDIAINQISFEGLFPGVFGITKTPVLEHSAAAEDGECIVKASYNDDAEFSDDVAFNVKHVNPNGKEYAELFLKTKNLLESDADKPLVYADFYDISFNQDGKEVEPETSVDMTLKFEEGFMMKRTQSLHIIHFSDDDSWELLPVSIESQDKSKENETLVKELTFSQNSFSKIGIVVFDGPEIFGKNFDSFYIDKISDKSKIKVVLDWKDKDGNSVTPPVTNLSMKLQNSSAENSEEYVSEFSTNNWECEFSDIKSNNRKDRYVFSQFSGIGSDDNYKETYQSMIDVTKLTYTEIWEDQSGSLPDLVDGGYYIFRSDNAQHYLIRASSTGDPNLRKYAPHPEINGTNFSVENIRSIDPYYSHCIWEAVQNEDETWSFKSYLLEKNKLIEYYITLVYDGSNYYWQLTNGVAENGGSNLTIDESGAISATIEVDNTPVTMYLDLSKNGGTGSISATKDKSDTTTKIQYYKYDGWVDECQINIVNTLNIANNHDGYKGSAKVSKTIDYLGDNENDNNPDTAADDTADKILQDLYRLYLDFQPQNDSTGVDMLFVLDVSSTMNTNDGNTLRRYEALVKALEGFLPIILPNKETKNRVSIVIFELEAMILQDWTNDSEEILKKIYDNGYAENPEDRNIRESRVFKGSGTNYEAGLMCAHEAFTRLGYSKNAKAMLFMSDGYPANYIKGNDSAEYADVTVHLGNGVVLTDDGPSGTLPTGLLATDEVYTEIKPQTAAAVESFKKHNADVSVSTIAIGGSVTEVPDALKSLKTSDGTAIHISDSDPEELMEAMSLMTELTPSDVSVIDVLSENVAFADIPDIKAVMTDDKGATTILYNNSKLTTEGKKVLNNANPIGINGREIKMTFSDDYVVEDKYTYTLSFNVRATQNAFNEYADSSGQGYTDVGSPDTDYVNNDTSSNKPGYFSNETTARVNWIFNNTKHVKYYDEYMPVIQVREGAISVKKVDVFANSAISGVVFSLYRAADENDSTAEFETITGVDGNYIKVGDGTTDTNGMIKFDHLRVTVFDEGYTYYLVETSPMPDYLSINEPIKLILYSDSVVLDGTYDNVSVLDNGATIEVGNIGFTKFGFTKVAAEDTSKPLQGAEFKLYRLTCNNSSHNHSAILDVHNVNLCWELFAEQTSSEDGKVIFEGIYTTNTYRLVETKAPKGYVLPSGQWTLTFSKDQTVDISAVKAENGCQPPAFSKGANGEYALINMKPINNPITGSTGALLFTIVGTLMMGAGSVIVFCPRRKYKHLR